MSTDPDGDSISYTFDWGDGSTVASILKSSGTTISATYSWANAGTYLVKVRGTDSNGNASAWSPTLTVGIVTAPEPAAIPNSPPTVPAAPSGITNGEVSSEYQYSAVTSDPEGDTLQYTFDWGDGSSSTTALLDSGVTAAARHTWSQPGTYAIQVKATDSKGAVSASSSALSVSILNQPEVVPSDPSDMAGREEPATPDSGSVDTLAAPAQVTSPAVTPAVQTPSGSPSIGPSDAVAKDASGNPLPASLDSGGSPLVGAHGSGFGWWLTGISVIVGAAFVLIRAIVRDTVPKPADGEKL